MNEYSDKFWEYLHKRGIDPFTYLVEQQSLRKKYGNQNQTLLQ